MRESKQSGVVCEWNNGEKAQKTPQGWNWWWVNRHSVK